jgi:hypothetical protein
VARGRDISIRYVVDLVDKSTKELLADDRKIRKEVKQTTRALEEQAREAKQAGAAMSRSAASAAKSQDKLQREAKATGQALDRQGRAGGSVVRSYRSTSTAADRAAKSNERFRRGLSGTHRVAIGAAGAIGALGLTRALRYMSDEVGEAQKATAQTAAGIRSTGGAANVTAKQVAALSSALARQSGIDDELIQQGANVVLTFKKIRNEAGAGNDVFTRTNQAALDLSVRFGKDLSSTAIQLGKALSDPVKGLTALKKSGVDFTESQKETITRLVETGDLLSAQKLILREVESQVGGSARAYGKTLPGAMGRASVALGDLAEKYGNKLAPFVEKAVTAASKFLRQIEQGKGAGGRFADTVSKIASGFADVARPIAKAIAALAKFVAKHPALLKIAGGIVAVGLAVKALKWAKAISGVGDLIGGLRRLAATKAGERARTAIVEAMSGLWKRLRSTVTSVGRRLADHFGRVGTTSGTALSNRGADAIATQMPAKVKASGLKGKLVGSFKGIGIAAGAVLAATILDKLAAEIIPGLDNLKKHWEEDKTFESERRPLGPLDPRNWRRGGRVYAGGGMVPVRLSPGELGVLPSGDSFVVPGRRTAADNVGMTVPPGTKIFTDHGQQLLAGGASFGEALAHQVPHFMSGGQVARLAYSVGARKRKLREATAISWAESGWDENAQNTNSNGSIDRGLWQINSIHGARSTFDPAKNAKGMWAISSRGTDWGPWVAYGSSRYQTGLTKADQAIKGMDVAKDVRVPGARKLSFAGGLPSPISAFASGFTAGLEGTRLWDVESIAGIVSGATTKLERVGGTKLPGRKADREGPDGAGPAMVGYMTRRADAIDKKGYPYSSPGNRGFGIGGPMDCSGAVSKVLGPNLLESVQASPYFLTWGEGGKGKHITTYSRGGYGASGHVFMTINGRGFGTSGENPGGGAGWFTPDSSYMAGFTARHPKGFARGGRVSPEAIGRLPVKWRKPRMIAEIARHGIMPGLRSGGVLAFQGGGIPWRQAGARQAQGRLAPIMRQLGGLDIEGKIKPILKRLADALDDVGRVTYRKLGRLANSLGRQIKRLQRGDEDRAQTVQIRRLEAAQRLVQVEMGRRTGLILHRIERQAEVLERDRNRLSQMLRVFNIDESSSAGLKALVGFEAANQQALERMRASLTTALARATKVGDKANAAVITTALEDVNEQIVESFVAQIELIRQAAQAAAAEAVEIAQHGLTRAQTQMAYFQAQQTAIGTQETPTGLVEQSNLFATSIIPALERTLAAQIGEYQTAAMTGASAAQLLAIQEQIESSQLEILNAQNEAAELLREAARRVASLALEAAEHTATMAGFATARAQGGVSLLEAQQRLAGTAETPEALRARAALTTRTVIPAMEAAVPAMEGVLAALQEQLRVAVETAAPLSEIMGLQEGIEQHQLNISQHQLEILNAQIEANELLRQAAATAAQAVVEAAQHTLSMAQGGLSLLEAQQQLTGTEGTEGGALERAALITGQIVPAMQASLQALNEQLRVALEQGEQSLVRSTLDAIQAVQTDIVNAMHAANEAMQAAAHAATESAIHVSTMGDLGLQHLELEQKLAGTFETGGAERAKFITGTIVPGIEAELEALRGEQAVAQAQNDQARLRELAELIAGKDNEKLAALLAAMELTATNTGEAAENTEKTIDALKQFGGTIGFEQRGQAFSDHLLGFGIGY